MVYSVQYGFENQRSFVDSVWDNLDAARARKKELLAENNGPNFRVWLGEHVIQH